MRSNANTKARTDHSSAILKIFATPVTISGALQSILSDRTASADLINEFLFKAMEDGLLPSQVVIAQFVGVPPRKESPYLDLRNQILVRKKQSPPKETLQGYAFTVGALKLIEWSFHKAATWECYGPAGSVIVFTLNQELPSPSFFEHANLFWMNYGMEQIPDFPFLRGIEISTPADGKLALVPVLDDPHNAAIIRRNKPKAKIPEPIVVPKVALGEKEKQDVLNFHEKVLKKKEEYFQYCLPSVVHGNIILVAPRPVYFTDSKQHEGVGDSGLAVVFEPDHEITSEDVERVYFVGQRLNNIFASLYSLAQGQRERGAANAVRLMEHSLGNTLGKLRLIAPAAKPHLELEEAMLKACRAVAGHAAVSLDSFPADALQTVMFDDRPSLQLEVGQLKTSRMDSRLIAIIIELCRNLEKHTSKMDEGSISITINSVDCPEIRVAGKATASQARRLIDRLREDWKGASLRGIPSLVLLANGISGPSASAKWFFARCDGVADKLGTLNRRDERVESQAKGPEWLFANIAPPRGRLRFTFTLSGLKSGLIQL